MVNSDASRRSDEVGHYQSRAAILTSEAARRAAIDRMSRISEQSRLPTRTAVLSCEAARRAARRAAAIASALNLQRNLARMQAARMPEHYETELEINDFPRNARWQVTRSATLGSISELTGAAIIVRGQYFLYGVIPAPGQRKLYLFFKGPTASSVRRAKAEVKRILEDYTNQNFGELKLGD